MNFLKMQIFMGRINDITYGLLEVCDLNKKTKMWKDVC